jgi:enamine deaminase RidA (YjgF/YER057c/UK114 family)
MHMTGAEIEARLAAQGYRLPEAVAPAYQYVAVVVHNDVAYLSGQIPRAGSQVLMTGKLGAEITLEQGQRAAEACVLQGLAQLRAELGDLGRVARIIKVTGFVASAAGFNQQPQVIDAASNLLALAFADAGRHARSAVGVAELPRNVPVEIEMIVAVQG